MDNQMQFKTIHGNPARFRSASELNHPRPMTLSAWTQTTNDDFCQTMNSVLELPNASDHGVNIVKVVCDKVRILQDSLRLHVDFLSEFCGNSNECAQLPIPQPHMLPCTNERVAVPIEGQVTPPNIVPEKQILTPPNSENNMEIVEEMPSTSAQHLYYKVIVERKNKSLEEHIENELKRFNNDNDLNTSADSDRLEICLEEEQTPKLEVIESNPETIDFLKRRRLNETQNICVSEMDATYTMQDIACTINVVTENTEEHNETPLSASPPDTRDNAYTMYSNVLAVPNANRNHVAKKNTPQAIKNEVPTENIMVSIGPNNTCVRADIFEVINWNSYSNATRKLMMEIFDRKTLATHSMTGKPSPAFKDQNRPVKGKLDPLKVQDIIFTVKNKTGASEKEIRNAITTKCADENKMFRVRMKRDYSLNIQNKIIDDKENNTTM